MAKQRQQSRQSRAPRRNYGDLGASTAYSNSGFQDFGGQLGEEIANIGIKVNNIRKKEIAELKLAEEKAGLMVEGFMANQEEGMDLTAIPDEDKGMITEFSMNQKDIFAEAAEAASTMKAGSPEKLEQMAIMKKANQRLKNVEKQYGSWGGMREDYIQDFKSKNLSVANNSGQMISAASIFTGAQKRSFDEDGNILFTDDQGNTTRMSDIKQPFEKAWKQGNQVNEAMMALYTAGEKLDDTTRPYLRNKFSQLIDNSGVEGLQSLAFDKMVGNESFFTEEEKEIIDSLSSDNPDELIEAKKMFKEQLLDKMMDVASKQADNGFNKNQAKIDKQNSKDDEGKIDVNSMIVRTDFEGGDIILPNKDPNDTTSNKVHSIQQERMNSYTSAAALVDDNYRVKEVKETNTGDYIEGKLQVFVTDPGGRKIAGPFTTEEKLSQFLEMKQSKK